MGVINFICFNDSFTNYNINYTKQFMQQNKNGPDYSSIFTENTPKKSDNLKLHLNKSDFSNYRMMTFIYKNHKLAINDTSPNAHQPFEDPILHKINKNPELRKRVKRKLLATGTIYNYTQLINDNNFTDIDLQSTSDLEIVLPLYIKYGIQETLNKLDGSFAFILTENTTSYELSKINIFAARDPYGIQPLWLAQLKEKQDFFLFTSDLNTIQASNYNITEVPPGTFWSWQTKKFTSYLQDQLPLQVIANTDQDTLTNLYKNFFQTFKICCLKKIDNIETIGILFDNLTNIGDVLLISMICYLNTAADRILNKNIHIFTNHSDLNFATMINDKFKNANHIPNLHYHIIPDTTQDIYCYIKSTGVKVLVSGADFEQLYYKNDTTFSDKKNIIGFDTRYIYYDSLFIRFIKSISYNLKNTSLGTHYIIFKSFSDILIR